jgi:predicted glycoside hydrolase/deacetylase ChbG (UPF0249 family)
MSVDRNGKKRLIVNADDFGWSRGITDGIVEAHHCGIVTSTSLMVNRPASEYALQRMKCAPNLSVGIHLTLCDGRPVLPGDQVPTLVTREGAFYSAAEVTRKLRKRQLSSREIEAEFRAQIQWMKRRNVMPTHADSHQHVHFYPSAIQAFCRAVKAEGIDRVRAACSRYFPRDGRIGGPYAGHAHRRVLVSAYNCYVQNALLRGLRLPDASFTSHPKFRGDLTLLDEGWKSGLASLTPGTYELGCHPGLYESGFSELDSIRDRREVEFRLLTESSYKRLIERNNIRLITYAEL